MKNEDATTITLNPDTANRFAPGDVVNVVTLRGDLKRFVVVAVESRDSTITLRPAPRFTPLQRTIVAIVSIVLPFLIAYLSLRSR